MLKYTIDMYEQKEGFKIEHNCTLHVVQEELDLLGLTVEEYAQQKACWYCVDDRDGSLLYSIQQEIIDYHV